MLQYNNTKGTNIINIFTNQRRRLHRLIITIIVGDISSNNNIYYLLKILFMMILSWCYGSSIGRRCTVFLPMTTITITTSTTKAATETVLPLLLFNTYNNHYGSILPTATRSKKNTILSFSIVSSLLSTTKSFGWTFQSKKYVSTNAYYNSAATTKSLSSSTSAIHVHRGGSYDHETDNIHETNQSNENKKKSNPKRIRRITFVTDIEGDKEYMKRYATISKIICFRPINDTDVSIIQQQNIDNTNNKGYQLKFPYKECLDFRDNSSTGTSSTTTTNTNDQEQDNLKNNIQYENIFVFGGDIWDQGGNDLYVIRQLLYLKYRYPSNVFLLIGNRDGNKMRILQELGTGTDTEENEQYDTTKQENNELQKEDNELQKENDRNSRIKKVPFHKGTYWLRGSGYLGDPLNGPLPYNQTSVKRLQWMLQYTMGSPKAFLYRKQELIEEQQQEQENQQQIQMQQQKNDIYNNNQQQQQPRVITDYDVVTSYRNSCHPITGEMGCYLSYGQLVLQFGSLLFVHGGLPISPKIIQSVQENITTNNNKDNFWNDLSFATPWIDRVSNSITNSNTTDESCNSSSTGQLSFDEWIIQLNKFASDCVNNWKDEYSFSATANTNTNTTTNTPLQSNQQLHQSRRHDMWSWTGGYHQQQQQPQQQQQELSSDISTVTTPDGSSSSSYVPKFTQLIQYGMGSLPNRIPNPTVVYNGCWKHYLPKDPPTTVAENNNIKNEEACTNKMGNNNDDDYHDDDDLLVQDIVQSFMKHTGIRLICCGHQPQGDMPNAIRVPVPVTGKQQNYDVNGNDNDNDNVGWIVSADTSYSGDTVWFNRNEDDGNNNSNNKMLTTDSNNIPQTNSKPSNKEQQQQEEKVLNRHNVGRGTIRSGRGPVAVSEVYIEQCIDTCTVNELYFHGMLCDGTMYKTTNFFQLDNNNDDENNNKQQPYSDTTDHENSNTINSDNTRSDKDASTKDIVVGTIAKGNLVPDRSISPHNGYWWNRATFAYLYKPTQSVSSSSDNDVSNNTSSVQPLFNNIIKEWNTDNKNTSNKHTTTATTTTESNNQKLQTTLTMIVARKGFQVWNHIIRSCK